MSSIEAKPTEYRGTLYRSRLEARWAVYLDHHPGILSPKYEPTTFYSPNLYTPDFSFFLKTTGTFYLEVKPSLPSIDYLLGLIKILTEHPISLLLAVGDFYKSEPIVYEMNTYKSTNRNVLGSSLTKVPLFGDSYALMCASGYRFDLAQPEHPGKGNRYANPSKAQEKGPQRRKKKRRRR